MADQSPESALRLPLHGKIEATQKPPQSPLVEEVVSQFDQLRDRLLRYVISFGLPVQDGEDIVGAGSALPCSQGRGSPVPRNRRGSRYFVRGRLPVLGAVADAWHEQLNGDVCGFEILIRVIGF